MSGGKSHSERHAADATSIEHRDRAASDAFAMDPQHAIEALQQSAGNRAAGRLLNEATQTSPRMGTGGTLLDAGVRQDMEARFAEPFQDVRVHADRAAAQETAALGAKAYTQGRDVFFGAGRYAPHAREGRHLLAHELAHVVQQARGGSDIPAGAEADADRVAATVAAGGTARVGTAAAPGVQCAPEETPWWKRVQKGAGAVVDRVAQAPAALKEAAVETKGRAVQKYDETKATVTQKLEKVTTKNVKAAALNTTERMLKPMQMLADVSGTARKKMAGAMTRAKGGKDEGRVTALNNMVVATDSFVQAWNRSQTEPTKVFVQTLKEKKGFVAAVKAAQQNSDETLEGMTDSFKQAVNDYEDGKFMPPAPKLIDPAKHPTLSAVEDKVGGAMGSVHGFQRQVQGGVMKALWSMGTGISQIGVHPVNTLRGLGEMPAAGPVRPVGQMVGLIDDLIVPPEGMTRKQVLDAHGEKQKFNPKRDFEQTKKLAMGFGENYIEALGGKVERNKQTGDMKIVGGGKERVGEIPGLLLVDVGSFFIPGGGATKGTKGLATAAKGGEFARTVGTVGEFGKTADVVSGVGKTAEATSGLAKTAEATSSFAKTTEGGAGVVKVADAGGVVKAADTSGAAVKTADVGVDANKLADAGKGGDVGKGAEASKGAGATKTGDAGKGAEAPPVKQPVEDLKKLLGDSAPANDVLPHGTPANDVLPHGEPPAAAAPQPEGAKVYDLPPDAKATPDPRLDKVESGSRPVTQLPERAPPAEPASAVQEASKEGELADIAAYAEEPMQMASSGENFAPSASAADRPPPQRRPKMPAGNPDFAPRAPEPRPPKTQPAPTTHPKYREMPKGPDPKRAPWTERVKPPPEKNPRHSPDVLDHGQPRDLLPVKEPPPGMTRGNMVHKFWRRFKELGVDIDRMWGESRKYLYDADGNALPHVGEKPMQHGELPRKNWGRVDAENVPGRKEIEIGPEDLRTKKTAEAAQYAEDANRFHELADPKNPFEGIFAGYNHAYADELAELWGLVKEEGKK